MLERIFPPFAFALPHWGFAHIFSFRVVQALSVVIHVAVSGIGRWLQVPPWMRKSMLFLSVLLLMEIHFGSLWRVLLLPSMQE